MKNKKLPKFRSEIEEQEFWHKNDSADYIDWTKSEKINFSKLKPSTETISLRLPKLFLESLKTIANKRDVPYQSLMKIFLAEKLKEEFGANKEQKKISKKKKLQGSKAA